MRERQGGDGGVRGEARTGGDGLRPVRDCEVTVWLDGRVVDVDVRGLAALSEDEVAAVAGELEQAARRIRAGWRGAGVVLH